MDSPVASPSSISQTGYNEYNAQLQAAALKSTRLSAALPSDLTFYRSVDKALAKDVDSCKTKVLSITNKLLHLASTNNGNETRARKRPRLENEEDIMDDFHGTFVDLMDQLLEKSVSRSKITFTKRFDLYKIPQDMRIDDYLGVAKAPTSIVENQNQTQVRVSTSKYVQTALSRNSIQVQKKVPQGRLDPALQHAARLPKPQLDFTRRVDNRNSIPWRHTLKHKYNAQVPLGYHWQTEDSDMTSPTIS